jgi:hypothetical protein
MLSLQLNINKHFAKFWMNGKIALFSRLSWWL